MAELNPLSRKSGGRNIVRKMPVRVDLTAMVDLAFLLITFYADNLACETPQYAGVMPADGPAGPVSEKQTITFCLGKNNHALWYMGMAGKPLTEPQLMSYGEDMRRVIAENAKQVLASTGKSLIVLVKPAQHSVYDNLVQTLDDLNNTGVPTYAIAAISPADIAFLKQKGIY